MLYYESFPHLAVQRNPSGKIDAMTSSEAATARTLVEQGNSVTRLNESRIPGQQTHDFLVNGQRTELWSPAKVGKGPSAVDTIKNGIVDKRGQGGADHMIVDASRQPALDRASAMRAARQALDSTTKAQLRTFA